MDLHVNWAYASAEQSKGKLACSGVKTIGFKSFVDKAPQQRDICRAPQKAPNLPTAGTSTVSSFNEELLVDLLVSADAIPLHAMDAHSKYFTSGCEVFGSVAVLSSGLTPNHFALKVSSATEV